MKKWSHEYPKLLHNDDAECTIPESKLTTVDHNMGFFRDPDGYAIGDCIDRIEDRTSRLHDRLIFFHCEFLDVPDPVRKCSKTYIGRFYLLPKSIQAEILQLAQTDQWPEIYELLAKRDDLIRIHTN